MVRTIPGAGRRGEYFPVTNPFPHGPRAQAPASRLPVAEELAGQLPAVTSCPVRIPGRKNFASPDGESRPAG